MIKIKEKIQQPQKKKTIKLVTGLANKIINELNFVETINRNVEWDEDHWKVSPGQLAKALVLSTFADIRVKLTHLEERLSGYDLKYLLDLEEEDQFINAFNVGRALERIGEGDVNASYETMALSALQKYDIPSTRIHSDTTTISFYGEYDIEKMDLSEDEKESILRVEKGYNKDGRAGDSQVVIGQMVNEHGIPLSVRSMDGSTSDIEWNKQALDYFDKLRNHGFSEGIYIADCKVVTEELVRRMNSKEGRISFVSRCPANFDSLLSKRMVEKAYQSSKWEDIGSVASGENAATYRLISFLESVYESQMRLVVLESSSLSAKAEKSLEKAKDKLNPLIRTLESKEFVCLADAQKEYERFVKMKELKLFEINIEIVEKTQEKWPRGRRSATTKPLISKSYQIHVTHFDFNEQRRKQYLQAQSSFVLISNVTDEKVSDEELLKIYKGQHVVETSFRQLKSPSLASVIYLKNPVRIEALTMLLNFSLLVRAIIQFRMREGLKKHNEENPQEPIYAGWKGRPLTSPTFQLLFEHAINCCFECEAEGEYSFDWSSTKTKNLVQPLLSLMGETVATLLQ